MIADDSRFTYAILISIGLHALLFIVLPSLHRLALSAPVSAPLEISLVAPQSLPPPRAAALPRPAPVAPAPQDKEAAPQAQKQPPPVLIPERQIVAPSDSGKEAPPKDARLLSDRDNTVEKEQIHRGDGAQKEAAQKSARTEASAEKKSAEAKAVQQAQRPEPEPLGGRRSAEAPARRAPEQVASLPSLDRLLPRAGDLVVQGRVPRAEEERAPRGEHARGSDLLASANAHPFSGRLGTTDFLPTIHEGDVTLLNTKADLFAPFVRRVAARVFEHLEISLQRNVATMQPGHQVVKVEAIMDKTGHFVRARVISREGANGLELDRRLLEAAVPDVFFDANPPAGAEADDGNIHFVLIADLTAEVDPQRGAAGRSYYGVAGVGLL